MTLQPNRVIKPDLQAPAIARDAKGVLQPVGPCPPHGFPIGATAFFSTPAGQLAANNSVVFLSKDAAADPIRFIGSGLLIENQFIITAFHVAAFMAQFTSPVAHVTGKNVFAVRAPVLGHGWLTRSTYAPAKFPAIEAKPLFNAECHRDPQQTVAAIQIPGGPFAGASYNRELVINPTNGMPICVIGTPDPLAAAGAGGSFNICMADAPPLNDIINLRIALGYAFGAPNALGLFDHSANTEEGMSGSPIFTPAGYAVGLQNNSVAGGLNQAVSAARAIALLPPPALIA